MESHQNLQLRELEFQKLEQEIASVQRQLQRGETSAHQEFERVMKRIQQFRQVWKLPFGKS
jgi:hypothetical protein